MSGTNTRDSPRVQEAEGDGDEAAPPMRRSISGDVKRVLAGDAGDQLASIVRGMAVPLIVSPIQYGLWRIVLLVWQYGIYLHLGAFALLNREVPGQLALGEHAESKRIRQTAFWGTMAVAFAAAIGLVAYSLTGVPRANRELSWALRISAVGLVVQQVFVYVMLHYRVHANFRSMSLVAVSRGVCSLVFMLPLGFIAGVPGLAAGMLLSTGLTAAAFGGPVYYGAPTLRVKAFLGQARRGVPLSSLPFLNSSIGSVGQVVSAGVLGLEAAGHYGLGLMMGTIVYAIPRSLGIVLYPRYLESYATSRGSTETGALMRRSLHVTSVTSTLAVCIGAILLKPLYYVVFPQYLPALAPSYALIAMMPFLSYALVLQNALLAMRLHAQVIKIQITSIVVSAVLSLLGALVIGDVLWVAVGVMVAHGLYGLATLRLGFSAAPLRGRSPLREVAAELVPALFMGGATLAILLWWRAPNEPSSLVRVALTQLLILSPIAAWFCFRTWRSLRPLGA